MARRICARCGKDKDVSGAKVCEKGHFICKDCVWDTGLFKPDRKYCPLCNKKLT